MCIPDQQRSWIGKAQFKDKLVSPKFYTPSSDPFSGGDNSLIHETISTTAPADHESNQPPNVCAWVLIEGTPATCTQLGLFHLFKDRGPIDLVVSGPNYGRNVTALFSLSSGTLGGAMESGTFQRKGIALSFAFWGREHEMQRIEAACRHSVKVIEHLYKQWASDVDVYSVNVPLVDGVEQKKVVLAPILQNYWKSGSCFEEVLSGDGEEDPAAKEKELREGEVPAEELAEKTAEKAQPGKGRSFRWSPKFADIQDSITQNAEESDGKAIINGLTRQVRYSLLPHWSC